jgi:hypothetical protein
VVVVPPAAAAAPVPAAVSALPAVAVHAAALIPQQVCHLRRHVILEVNIGVGLFWLEAPQRAVIGPSSLLLTAPNRVPATRAAGQTG